MQAGRLDVDGMPTMRRIRSKASLSAGIHPILADEVGFWRERQKCVSPPPVSRKAISWDTPYSCRHLDLVFPRPSGKAAWLCGLFHAANGSRGKLVLPWTIILLTFRALYGFGLMSPQFESRRLLSPARDFSQSASPGHAPPCSIFGLVDERPPQPDDLPGRHPVGQCATKYM